MRPNLKDGPATLVESLRLPWLGPRKINSRLPMGGRQEEGGRCQGLGMAKERATPAPKTLGRMYPQLPNLEHHAWSSKHRSRLTMVSPGLVCLFR